MNLPKQQHWIPQFYLHYFATPETQNKKIKKTWVSFIDRGLNESRTQNIESICSKKYLNSPKNHLDERDFSLEIEFSKLETLTSQFWSLLATGFTDFSINCSSRKGIAQFLSTLYLRNIDSLRKIKSVHQQIVDFYRDYPLKLDGTPKIDSIKIKGKIYKLDTSSWQEYQQWHKNEHKKFFVNFIRAEAIHFAKILLKKR